MFWKGLPPVDLPADIVAKYNGKGMAVVGFELDQVRRTADGDVSVPITCSYNHHFESNMVGARASLHKVSGPPPGAEAPGHGYAAERYDVREDLAGELPSHQAFGAANGGEVRKSFHGYAPGFAQVRLLQRSPIPTHYASTAPACPPTLCSTRPPRRRSADLPAPAPLRTPPPRGR